MRMRLQALQGLKVAYAEGYRVNALRHEHRYQDGGVGTTHMAAGLDAERADFNDLIPLVTENEFHLGSAGYQRQSVMNEGGTVA